MVLHGATQWVSNGVRATLLWRDIYWRGLGFYLGGALLAFVVLWRFRFVPNHALVFLGLGLSPFVAALLPARVVDFQRPLAAALCGLLVNSLNLLAGAAGPLLDVAFVDTRLSKNQIVATKAITQVFAHSLKIAYFVPLLAGSQLSAGLLLAILAGTILGTRVGTRILARLSDRNFRVWSRGIVYAMGCLYLSRACLELL
jgi:uncharacterized membrane protein YfcA